MIRLSLPAPPPGTVGGTGVLVAGMTGVFVGGATGVFVGGTTGVLVGGTTGVFVGSMGVFVGTDPLPAL
jgi:hypothetical protein